MMNYWTRRPQVLVAMLTNLILSSPRTASCWSSSAVGNRRGRSAGGAAVSKLSSPSTAPGSCRSSTLLGVSFVEEDTDSSSSSSSSSVLASKEHEQPLAAAGPTSTTILADDDQFVKPERDPRRYRVVRLANNLVALLVCDEMSSGIGVEAASVHVQAGHMDDTIPGLARESCDFWRRW